MLLPKPRPKTALRGSAPISATLPGPALGVLRRERAMAMEILPAIAFAHIAGARRSERILLSGVDGRKRETEGALLGRKHASRLHSARSRA